MIQTEKVTTQLDEYLQYGKWTFKNVTEDVLGKITDPAEPERLEKNKDSFVPRDTSPAAQKAFWQRYFSPAAMERSPVISETEQTVYKQGQAAIDKFFDGTMSADELGSTLQGLSDQLLDACKEEGYPLPLFNDTMKAQAMECFYSEFRRMILDTAVQRNNAEGKQYITGKMCYQRNYKYYNSDYYFQSEDAISALTDKFLAKVQESGLEGAASVPDYKAKGLNLYYNFNSAVSNDFDIDDRYVIDKNQIPPKDFRWFFQTGGNDSHKGKLTSMAVYSADGTLEEYTDFTTPGFDPTDPLKGTCWAAYKDENGNWQYTSADFEKKYVKEDLKNMLDLLEFSGKAGPRQEAVNQFLKNLQYYPRGYFSAFSIYESINQEWRV